MLRRQLIRQLEEIGRVATTDRCRAARMAAKVLDGIKDPRVRLAFRMKLRWEDPAFRERHAKAVRKTLEKRWEDPAFRERHAKAVRKNWEDPAFRERNAKAVRKNWEDPAFRERHAKAVRKNWEDPAFRERHAKATWKGVTKHLRRKILAGRGVPPERIEALPPPQPPMAHDQGDARTSKPIPIQGRPLIAKGRRVGGSA